ncbi:MAG: histidinol-phosphate transaminase [Acidobacteria bacterium]|nr:MAG: histidinol-phosphate transaminase [Acidobacteriota bacterium]
MPRHRSAASRRKFLELTGMGVIWAGLPSPSAETAVASNGLVFLPVGPLAAARTNPSLPVYIDSNENPHGPSEKAIMAMKNSFSLAGRYVHNPFELQRALCQHHQVGSSMIEIGYGSSEILKMAVEAFLGPGKNVVVGQPTYEAIPRYGAVYNAETIRVPLSSQHRHDLKRMRAAVNDKTGLVYICNPNNPTATVVSGNEMADFLTSMPTNVPVLIDEAYYHYADDPSYVSSIPFAAAGKAVVVTRTFSKIYGMAGLRLGYAVGREDLIGRMSPFKIWLNMNALTVAAGLASLDDKEFVGRNQKLNAQTRRFVEEQVAGLGLKCIPSQANFLMIDLRREVFPVLNALRARSVFVGRVFAPLTTHMRVTIGTEEEMKRFVEELKHVLP